MDQQADVGRIGKGIVAGWLAGGAATVVLMLAAAVVLYLTDAGSGGVRLSVYGICIVSALCGGWLAGHRIRYRKFLWGLAVGILYYLSLCILSALSGGMGEGGFDVRLPALLMCLGSSMLGGMLG